MTTKQQRPAIASMYAGLALTVAATSVPLVDHATGNVLANHIRAGYPTYTPARIDTAATTYLIYLSVLGVIGSLCWLWTIRAVKARKRWARETTSAIFALATAIALFDLIVKDTSGETGLPPLLGLVGLLPCLAGLLAVSLLWRKS
jgi:cytochrome bd-type quinol oxidase subunit 2